MTPCGLFPPFTDTIPPRSLFTRFFAGPARRAAELSPVAAIAHE